MRHPVVSLAVLLTTSLTWPGRSTAQGEGSISGTVLDDRGIPVSEAKVNADLADGRRRGSLIRYVETDSSGHFVVDHLEWSTYRIFTAKEQVGYPNTRASFYSHNVFPTVRIETAAPKAEVRVQLGPKAGILVGSITNAATGAPVNGALKLSRVASPNEWISTSVPPEYKVLLPPSTDVLLEASATGYKTWLFPSPLRLEPGAEMRLDIALEPAHDPNIHPSRFLIPAGFVGWLRLEYGVKDAEPAPVEAGVKVFKFPKGAVLDTSSPGPEAGAQNEYLYYTEDGSLNAVPRGYKDGKGMIWGEYSGSRAGVMSLFGFFTGTEDEYKKHMTH